MGRVVSHPNLPSTAEKRGIVGVVVDRVQLQESLIEKEMLPV